MNNAPSEDRARRSQVVEALRRHDLRSTDAGQSVATLAPQIEIESPEVVADDVVMSADDFSGSFVWHVTFSFPDPAPSVRTSETFPGFYRGHFDGEAPRFDAIEIDLGSLSEPKPSGGRAETS